MDKKKVVYPYIPNSVPHIQEEMLKEIGAESIDEFFECIPYELRLHKPLDLPAPLLSEIELKRHVQQVLSKNATTTENISFLGGGCWNHYVPAICDEINQRSEFLTAYAGEPYEDHGRFQALFEYESMMAELVDMDVVNVPTYDGAQAAATAIRMASRIANRSEVLVAENIHPETKAVIKNYCNPDLSIVCVPCDPKTGCLDVQKLKSLTSSKTAVLYFENPSFIGTIDSNGSHIAKILHEAGALMVVGVDPSSMGLLTPPSRYGADIVCGDLQPLGMHQCYGGARGGFMATRDDETFVREYPSRLFGIAPTTHGEWGFGDVAWERTSFAEREKAKEFVGTAAALWGITAGVYVALMGPKGMKELGENVYIRCQYLMEKMAVLPGVKIPLQSTPHFKEFIVNFDGTGKSVKEINKALLDRNIFGGLNVSKLFPSYGESALYSVTEVTTQQDMDTLITALGEILV
ncbi:MULTISPECIES: aminomethyl-transferring glycine dehydrogenase subunit GcvPA [Aminobacterium]|jgi:glycine dehydrogenase subunit 1|uniref:aminomethyl-transferring glycine dehydrogenase subunit GcvPA n=1 Tax=Aminobacterium TaxID=81466 RepID=UPI000466C27A|nr:MULTISPECIES: aminomethyl-transferring glycine dehydrogenase subunit GcvPA [Aminobacterium]